MDIYLLRHAIAIEPGVSEHSEEERPLSPEGIQEMTLAVRGMRALEIAPTTLLSSPLTRALQTARIVREQLEIRPEIEIRSFLAPGGSFREFSEEMKRRREPGLMLVGHEPTLSLWTQQLLGCGPESNVLLKKGALAHLHVEWEGYRPVAQLLALLQPSMLIRMK